MKNIDKKKYYFPEIEELFIGYQYESKTYKEEDYWLPEKIDVFDFRSIHSVLKFNLIRVPYLTIEILENEGWIKDYTLPSADGISMTNEKYDYYVQFLIENNGYNENYNVDANFVITNLISRKLLFLGNIKSINEFNYVCKLLNK